MCLLSGVQRREGEKNWRADSSDKQLHRSLFGRQVGMSSALMAGKMIHHHRKIGQRRNAGEVTSRVYFNLMIVLLISMSGGGWKEMSSHKSGKLTGNMTPCLFMILLVISMFLWKGRLASWFSLASPGAAFTPETSFHSGVTAALFSYKYSYFRGCKSASWQICQHI